MASLAEMALLFLFVVVCVLGVAHTVLDNEDDAEPTRYVPKKARERSLPQSAPAFCPGRGGLRSRAFLGT
jgi:hypothetical protein